MAKSDNVVIRVDGVYKNFKLPHEKTTTIKGAFLNLARKKRVSTTETQHALKNISFEVKKGEFLGIVGRNGSGKSTLLKMLAGIYEPTKGKIEVGGKLVPFIELGVGFNPELSGRDNVYLNGALLGFSRTQVDRMYDEIVEFAELEKFMDQKLKNYSSGMQVRLAFSMAVRADADILLVDEVLAVGDADFQRKCFDYFRTLKRNKKTVVFVSHDMSAVQQYCDRAILIDSSELVQSGHPSTISASYNKLFMTESVSSTDEPSNSKNKKKNKLGPSGEERWGDGQASFTKIKAKVDNNENKITIEASCVANQDIETPIFGFSIKNQLLQQLIGTNTVRKNIALKPLKRDEKITVKWEVPNIFNEGEYYIDCTVAHDEASSVADRWPDAVAVRVSRDEKNPYLMYSPDVKFSQEN